jgi:serine phosphatase RsbU (regulator of sigma subunit)
MIIAPIRVHDRTLGALTLLTAESERIYTKHDLQLAEELARRAGLALEQARLFEERANVARSLQRSLLPPSLPSIPGIDLAVRYLPAGSGNEVGGDFYDVFRSGRRRWDLVVGDVCGKGPEAAALTGLARHTVRAAALERREPSLLLSLLNTAILREGPGERFCTVVMASLELGNGPSLTVCCGGHPLPLLVTDQGEARFIGRPGTLIGLLEEIQLHDEAIPLSPGDQVVFYTDGVTEARDDNGEIFGSERLRALVSASSRLDPPGLAARIEEAVLEFDQGSTGDDIAILILRVGTAASG